MTDDYVPLPEGLRSKAWAAAKPVALAEWAKGSADTTQMLMACSRALDAALQVVYADPEAARTGAPSVDEPSVLADHGFAWIGQAWSGCDECGRPAAEHLGMSLARRGASWFDLSDDAREIVPWEVAVKRVPLAGAYGLLDAVRGPDFRGES